MDALRCLEKLKYVGVLAFATVDRNGNPQVRNISAIHYEKEALYFFTTRGKDFCKELQQNPNVQILGYTKYKEMIRLSGEAEALKMRMPSSSVQGRGFPLRRDLPIPANASTRIFVTLEKNMALGICIPAAYRYNEFITPSEYGYSLLGNGRWL